MGFNPWNVFGTDAHHKPKLPGSHGFNLSVMVDVADAMVSKGFAKAGYRSVNLDCGWSTGYRDKSSGLIKVSPYEPDMPRIDARRSTMAWPNSGRDPHRPRPAPAPQVNEKLYPGGLEAYVAAMHSRGLEAGLYLDAGHAQCCSRQLSGADDGSLGHEATDAKWLAGLGFTWLKYDNCGSEEVSYDRMAAALNSTGQTVMLSVHGPVGTEAVNVSNMWRATPDITNTWASVVSRALLTATLVNASSRSSAPGSWAMADMLEAFNGTPESPGLTAVESRSHFAMWAALKSPLVLGNNVITADEEAVAALTNAGVIAINQDPLGEPATVAMLNTTGLWLTGRLSGGKFVAVVVNLAGSSGTLGLDFAWLPGWQPGRELSVVNAWTGQTLGRAGSDWTSSLQSHEAAVLTFA